MELREKRERTGAAAITLLGFVLLLWHSRHALSGWYLREDARFFAVGIPSLHDLLGAFAAPMNSMGQYRPVTRVLWALPAWLGLPLPASYHALSVLLVAAGGFFLAWFCRLWFGRPVQAAFVGSLYVLLPVHAKALHWISAWHNSALVLFFLAAMVFRVRRQRWLCLGSVFLALASREVAFALVPVLFYLDRAEGRPWRESFDFSALTVLVGVWLFVLNSPLAAAGVQPGAGATDLFLRLARYAESAFFTTNDLFVHGSPWLAGAAILALPLLGLLLFRKSSRPLAGTLVALLGIAPFLLVPPQVEYAALFAAGVLMSACGLLSLPAWRFRAPVPWIYGAALLLVAWAQGSVREYYRSEYVEASLEARRLVGEVDEFAKGQPPGRLLVLEGFGPHREGKAKMSLHLLSEGIDELVPTRAFAITRGNDSGAPFTLRPDIPARAASAGSLPPVYASFTGEGIRVRRD